MAGSTLLLVVVVLLVVVIRATSSAAVYNYEQEKDPSYWHGLADAELLESRREPTLGVAKNVIMFLGDGMGPATVTAARILAGQLTGNGKGEEHKLHMDKMQYTGYSKTYNVNKQITDSAASGTAYLTGVKTNQGMLGLSAKATRGNCSSSANHHVDSILRWSAEAGKSTGVISTARITHASPGAAYSHIPERDWESDRLIPVSERGCEDIALQLVTRNSDINVIMGGGRAYFYPVGVPDPAPDPNYNTSRVSRTDGRNLVQEWMDDKKNKSAAHKYVYNKAEFDAINAETTDYVLGLFTQSHMTYEQERDTAKEPSLAEMTTKAINMLKRNDKGFFLFVEGGRIDHAHHDTKPSKALHETIAMDDAIAAALALTDSSETLVVVTADHSHVMAIAGYADRGNHILDLSKHNEEPDLKDVIDKMPYTTIIYGNGPGYASPRQNLTNVDTEQGDYISQAAVPMPYETHGGEDVPIFASGPQSFLYGGVHEQSYIPMVMAYASCVGPYADGKKPCAAAVKLSEASCNKNNLSPALLPSIALLIVCIITNAVLRRPS